MTLGLAMWLALVGWILVNVIQAMAWQMFAHCDLFLWNMLKKLCGGQKYPETKFQRTTRHMSETIVDSPSPTDPSSEWP